MKELYDKLDENARYISDIENYYGGLRVSSDDNKFYWGIKNWDGENWKEIPEELYRALLKYQEEYKHKQNGGPVVPFSQISETTGQSVNGFYDTGMSLRDWFAGLALQGICASGPGSQWSNEMLTQEAYHLADAMLAQREKQE